MSPIKRRLRTIYSRRRWRQRFAKLARRASILILWGGILSLIAFSLIIYWYFTKIPETEVVLVSGQLEIPLGVQNATLYFAAASGDSLAIENRLVLVSETRSERIRRVVQELTEGPGKMDLRQLMPRGTRIQHVFIDEGGIAFLDFSRELRQDFNGGSTAEYLLLTSLLSTVYKNVPSVRGITITVDGRPLETLGGHFPLRAALLVGKW